jgi:hypothetical protein
MTSPRQVALGGWAKPLAEFEKVDIFDYYKKREMPVFVEPLLERLVAGFPALPEPLREEITSSLGVTTFGLLGWYARRLAGRAVREASKSDLLKAIIAEVIGRKWDPRDSMSGLALIVNSARKLGVSPGALADCLGSIAGAAHSVLDPFLARPTELQSIRVFGFSEGVGPLGFDYVPLLPEYGGPSPLTGR